MDFRILIYSDYHLLWLFLCSDMLLCLLLGTFYVLYIMCFHIYYILHNIVFMACFSLMMEHQICLSHCLIWKIIHKSALEQVTGY